MLSEFLIDTSKLQTLVESQSYNHCFPVIILNKTIINESFKDLPKVKYCINIKMQTFIFFMHYCKK